MPDGWLVSNGKKQLGPFTAAKMRALAQAGKLRAGMRISRDGTTWTKASDSDFLSASAAPPAPLKPRRLPPGTAELDPLPDPFAAGALGDDDPDGDNQTPSPADDDSDVIDPIPDPAADDSEVVDTASADDSSGVLDSGPADDESGVFESGPAEGDNYDDDSSGVIAATAEEPDAGDATTGHTPDDGEPAPDDDALVAEAGPSVDDDPTEPGELYRCRAQDADGREQTLELKAESKRQAFRRLRERGLEPIMALPKRGFAGWPDRPPPPAALPGLLALIGRGAAVAATVDRVLGAVARAQGGAAARIAVADRSRAVAIALFHAILAGLAMAGAGRLDDVGAGLVALVFGFAVLSLALAVAWSTTRAAIDRARRAFGVLVTSAPDPREAPSRARILAALPGVALGAALLVNGTYHLAPSTFAWTEPPLPMQWLALVLTATLDALDPFRTLDLNSNANLVPISVLGHALVMLAQVAMMTALALAVARELVERLPLAAALAALVPAPTRAAATSVLTTWAPPPLELLTRALARATNPAYRRALAHALASLPAELSQPALVSLAAHERGARARADIAWAVGQIAALGGAEKLAAWLLHPAWHAHRATIIEALVATADRHAAPGLVEFLSDPNHRDLHVPAARALVALDDPEQREALWSLLDLDRAHQVRIIAAAGLGRIGGEDDYSLLEAALDDEPDPLVSRWVRRAIDAIADPESRGTLAALELELDALAAHGVEPTDTKDLDATVRTTGIGPSGDGPGET